MYCALKSLSLHRFGREPLRLGVVWAGQAGELGGWQAGVSELPTPQWKMKLELLGSSTSSSLLPAFSCMFLCKSLGLWGCFGTIAGCEIAADGEQRTWCNLYKVSPFSVRKGFLPKDFQKWRFFKKLFKKLKNIRSITWNLILITCYKPVILKMLAIAVCNLLSAVHVFQVLSCMVFLSCCMGLFM